MVANPRPSRRARAGALPRSAFAGARPGVVRSASTRGGCEIRRRRSREPGSRVVETAAPGARISAARRVLGGRTAGDRGTRPRDPVSSGSSPGSGSPPGVFRASRASGPGVVRGGDRGSALLVALTVVMAALRAGRFGRQFGKRRRRCCGRSEAKPGARSGFRPALTGMRKHIAHTAFRRKRDAGALGGGGRTRRRGPTGRHSRHGGGRRRRREEGGFAGFPEEIGENQQKQVVFGECRTDSGFGGARAGRRRRRAGRADRIFGNRRPVRGFSEEESRRVQETR